MKSKFIESFVKPVVDAAKRHRSEILTGLGLAGIHMAFGIVIHVKPKIDTQLAEKKKALHIKDDEKLDIKETAKIVVPGYGPAVVLDIVSMACIIGASAENYRRNAALATAYAFSENAFKDYKEKATAVVGEKKVEAINDAIAKDKLEKNPVSKTNIIVTKSGETLCYDAYSGRYFKSDIERIRKAVVDLNMQMIDEYYVSLNDFYSILDLDGTKTGDMVGWRCDRGQFRVDFDSQLADDGTPCLVIDFDIAPKYDYQMY